jgi:DNA end-binding protein Ku
MARASMTNTITFGLINVPVKAYKAVDGRASKGGLQRLCECCEKPFKRPADECEAGNHPTSEAAEKRGDPDLTGVVYGVESKDGWEVVDEDAIADAEDAVNLNSMEFDRVVKRDEFPLHLVEDYMYLSHDPKSKGALDQFALLGNVLDENDWVGIIEYDARGKSFLAGVHVIGDVLALSVVPYRDQVREPEDIHTEWSRVTVDDDSFDLAQQLLAGMEGPFEYSKYVDERDEAFAAAIDAAMKDKELPTRGKAKDDTKATKANDLMAQLQASVAAQQGKTKSSAKRRRSKAAA